MEGNRLTEKATLRKEIRDYIQQQIASGRFKAGDRIVETQMARELGVSQAPVREASLELAAMGLLEERPSTPPGPFWTSTPPGGPPCGLLRISCGRWRRFWLRWTERKIPTTSWRRTLPSTPWWWTPPGARL